MTYRMEREFDALGNMPSITVDRNGDGMYTGLGESSETRTFNDADEIVTRTSLDPNVTAPTWFADGALNKDGEGQHHVYDAWGNLVRVEVEAGNALVMSLRRDALNRIIAQHSDLDGDGLATAADLAYTYLPDGAGRDLVTFKEGNATPRLERLFAGPESLTGSREVRDDDGDGTADRVTYVLPDATGSAAGFFDLSTGQMERVHYNPMGVPTCLPSGYINGDGKTDTDDYILLNNDVATQTYDDKSDVNADGEVDVWDTMSYEPKIGGTGVLSLTGNTLGLHQMRRANASYLAGARTFSESLGRWTSKDPSGYVDGPSLYQAMRGNVFSFVDRGGRQASERDVDHPIENPGPMVEAMGHPGRTTWASGGVKVIGDNATGTSSGHFVNYYWSLDSVDGMYETGAEGCKAPKCKCRIASLVGLNIDPIDRPEDSLDYWWWHGVWPKDKGGIPHDPMPTTPHPSWNSKSDGDVTYTPHGDIPGMPGNSTPYVFVDFGEMDCDTSRRITFTATGAPRIAWVGLGYPDSVSISIIAECQKSAECKTGPHSSNGPDGVWTP
ncbi:MAG: hypothetical protein KDB61_05785, partial [Planctomycetes bacterium]|nr:hypothetical protein [Planctomycetota bacterium]